MNRDVDVINKTKLADSVIEAVIDVIKGSRMNPDDVFPTHRLREWALDNGFVEEA